MRYTSLFFATLMTLTCLSTNACSAPKGHIGATVEASDCRPSSRLLNAVEHGDVDAIDQAVPVLACYRGGQASSIHVALGNMITRHPERILSAMHANHLSAAEISDISANQPWNLTDQFCDLLDELNLRISSLEKVKKYDRERRIAINAIHDFKSEVTPHCNSRPSPSH